MRIPPKAFASISLLSVVVMAGVAGAVMLAQTPAGGQTPPSRTRVQTVQIKPDMLRAWLDFQRTETMPALKKSGTAWRWVFSNGGPVGPGFTYTLVTPLENYAQFDAGPAIRRAMTPEAYAKYQDKERTMLTGSTAVVQTMVQNASLVSGSATAPPLAVVTTIQLLPGRGQEFASMTASDFLPALKKAGVTDYWVFATSFGGPPGQRTIVAPISKWADLDAGNPLVRALGAEAAQKVNLKRVQLSTGADQTVVSFVPDLSFGAPAAPKH
jgi:hypothetical protein